MATVVLNDLDIKGFEFRSQYASFYAINSMLQRQGYKIAAERKEVWKEFVPRYRQLMCQENDPP